MAAPAIRDPTPLSAGGLRGPSLRAGGGDRPVAHAADGHDVARPDRIVAELLAQPLDKGVDRPVEDDGLAARVDRVHELVARKDAPVRREERRQEAELERCQARVAPGDGHLVAVAVEDEVAAAQDRGRARPPPRTRTAVATARAHAWTRTTSSAGEKGLGR